MRAGMRRKQQHVSKHLMRSSTGKPRLAFHGLLHVSEQEIKSSQDIIPQYATGKRYRYQLACLSRLVLRLT